MQIIGYGSNLVASDIGPEEGLPLFLRSHTTWAWRRLGEDDYYLYYDEFYGPESTVAGVI